MDLQEGGEDEDGEKSEDVNRIGVKLTKAERRAKIKKSKKDAKKKGKELPEPEDATTEAPQAAVLVFPFTFYLMPFVLDIFGSQIDGLIVNISLN